MTIQNDLPDCAISLEFFPPKSVSAERALMTASHALRQFGPDFQTVTFGADGSEIGDSLDWPARLQNLNEVPTAAHVSLSRFASQEALMFHLGELWEMGVRRLVVIRGDGEGIMPGLEDVAQGVTLIKQQFAFDISVSAYPEVHPRATSAEADINVLLAKQAAGASRAITQFFFNNQDFYDFRERAEKAGYYRELIPGVMPVSDIWKISRFARGCGAAVPQSMVDRFADLGDCKEAHTKLAREIVSEQVADLAENGVDALHIYTMNRIDLTADAIRAFQKAHKKISGVKKLRLVS